MHRTLVALALIAFVAGCSPPQTMSDPIEPPEIEASIQLVDPPAEPGGPASGIDPDSIHVVVGPNELTAGSFVLEEVTDPGQMANPGSEASEYVVRFHPERYMTGKTDDIYVFCADKMGNKAVARLLWYPGRFYRWEFVSDDRAQQLWDELFPPPPRFVEVDENADIFVEGDQIMCTFVEAGGPYLATGSALEELEKVGLSGVQKVEALVQGKVDRKEGTVEIAGYQVRRLVGFPKMRYVEAEGRAFLFVAGGKLLCDMRDDEMAEFEVAGNKTAELRNFGLEAIAKAEMTIKGTIDLDEGTIDIQQYRLERIYPKD